MFIETSGSIGTVEDYCFYLLHLLRALITFGFIMKYAL